MLERKAAKGVMLERRAAGVAVTTPSFDPLRLTQVAFDLSPGDLEADDEQRDAAASLRLLPDASGLESEGEDERAVASPTAPPRRTRIPQKLNDDVNVLLDGERSSEYENLSSDESDSDGICDGDCDTGGDECDEEDDELSDSDAAEMDEAFLASLHIGGDGELSKAALNQRAAALRAMRWTPVSTAFETDTPSYPGLGADEARPVGEMLDVWRSPLLTLLYFVPKTVWVSIARETNCYFLQRVGTRAERMAARQTGRHRETVAQISRRLKAAEKYGTHEILRVVGLLVARMLCPQNRRFAAHWSMVEEGAIPAGLFGRYMTRDRCQNILRDLHFVDNTADHGRDKLWKLRPVVDKIQERFLAGCSLPAVFSFDEGVLPATSKRNTTRMFMSDKPHRYGTKLFMLCDAKTAYYHRRQDWSSGRLAEPEDCVHSSIAPQLACCDHRPILHLGSSTRGAAEDEGLRRWNDHDESLGVRQEYQVRAQDPPSKHPKGFFSLHALCRCPRMISCLWWDCKPIHYLCAGSVMTPSTIERKVKRVGAIQVGCPQSVKDYQNWMGGVDRHDQLRLQSYSLQMSTRFTKYHKGLFLGFLDLALVNAFLTHKVAAKIKGTVAMKCSEWFTVLQNQLLQRKAEDFAGVEATPPPCRQKRRRTPVRLAHALEQSEDWVTVTGVQKCRQRSCKVCALLRTEKKKSFATTYFCERYSIDNAKCWLCNKIRREYKAVAKTCFEIWHDDFGAGQNVAASLGKRVVLRRPGKNAGQRKKTRREPQLVRGEGSAGGDSDPDSNDE
ncbi:unnamed protein product [Phytophthora fragariaefolia]|uniref:Unnamed protein product n=1 Tax=Phytophthora fragariaefolia TaxID=1490495 RepID=A0A9W6XT06_9STRA|nr:unnamed protein product [Phytophthora fragariaefolia]